MSTASRERVGQVLLGEHRLERLARSDGAIEVYEARSTIDQGTYTVALAPAVAIETSAMAIEEAIERAGRHATGLRGLLSLLRGAVVGVDDRPTLLVVRRGQAHEPLPPGPLPGVEVERLLSPVAATLTALHDQGVVHGAVGRATVALRQGAAVLDLFGLGSAAEAASGARGARDVVAPAYRPPELRGDRPSSPGPWSDLTALGILALELLAGREGLLAGGLALPPLDSLGLPASPRLADLFQRLFDPSPARRPTSAAALLRELVSSLEAPAPVASAPVALPPPPADRPGDVVPAAPRAAAAPAPRPGAGAPPAPPLATQDEIEDRIEARQRRVLGALLVAGGLLMVGGVGAAVLFTMRGAGGLLPAAPATASGAAAVPTGPLTAPTARATAASGAAMPPSKPRGPLTYPGDEGALVPVKAPNVVWGDREALVTVVMFGDLTCPFSARALAAMPALVERHEGDLRLVYRHYPAPSRADAQQAAEAGAAVLALDGAAGWWTFAASISPGGKLDDAQLEQLAVGAGTPAGAVTKALADHSRRAGVEEDIALGRRLGVRGTPVFFVNGRRLDGLATEHLAQLVADELRKAQGALRSGATAETLYARRVVTTITTGENDRPRGRP